VGIFETYSLTHNNVLSVYSDRDRIDLSPSYQRQGEIWSLEKKQLLIDSIVNRYDIPKLYFHKLDKSDSKKRRKDYAVVDGRQRLEAIFGFIDGEYSLAKDFEYLPDDSVSAGSMTYADLAKKYPKLKQRIDAFALPIVVVEAEDLDLIDDLFFRLNEAVPLNAAEKRNAIGGDMSLAIKEISDHDFFKKKIRFSNKRYQHLEVSARILFIESNWVNKKLIDTKKPLLDQFVRENKSGNKKYVKKIQDSVASVLNLMLSAFSGKDILLASQGAVPIYYLLFREASAAGLVGKISRKRLLAFNEERQRNRELASEDLSKANYELLEYDRMSQQGTNDASSIRERYRIIKEYMGI
jgi:Protein of unknown function DUF262